MVLLAGGGLTLRAFQRMQDEPLGFRPENVLLLSVSLPEAHYPESDPEKAISFHTRLLEQVRALAGSERGGAGAATRRSPVPTGKPAST